MTVRSKQLYAGLPATGSSTLYTVPAGHTTIVRTVTILSGSATAGRTILLVFAGVIVQVRAADLNLYQRIDFNTWHVLEAGDTIDWVADTNLVHVLISGAELLG